VSPTPDERPAATTSHASVPGDDDANELFEHAPCGYLIMQPDGIIVRANATLLEWTGYQREDLIGRRRFVDLLSRGGQVYYETHYAPLLTMQGSVSEIAFDVLRRDGTRVPMLVNASVEHDPQGAPRSIRAALFDARQRRSYERELVRMRDVERAARERTERLQRVSSALAATLEPREIGEAVLAAVAPSESAPSALLLVEGETFSIEVVAWRGARPSFDEARLDHEELAPVLRALEGTADGSDETPSSLLGIAGSIWGEAVAIRPCVAAGRTVGVLAVGRNAAALEDADDAFLTAVSEQCALALERTRLHRQIVADAARARLLARVASGLGELHDVAGRTRRLQELLVPEIADEVTLRVPDEPAPGEGPGQEQAELARRALASHSLQLASAAGATLLALPLVAGGAPLGVLVLERLAARPGFSDSEISLVRDIGASATTALAGARLFEQERDVAQTLQASLLSGAPPVDPRIELATFYAPAVRGLNVGGDWYDAFTAAPGRVSLVVGDIVGQGLAAASAMGRLRSAVRAFAVSGSRPGALLQQLDAFVAIDAAARMATLVYVEIELATGVLSMASAGHPPAVVIEPGARPRLVWEGRSPPLGVFAAPTERADARFEVAAGTRVVLYTDGLVERREYALDVGFERLVEAAAHAQHAPVASMLDDIVRALLDEPTHDDVCILGLEVSPAPLPL
jgi:serine/threonine-protein kinase RsbW